jgi:hypothetical protein
MIAVLNRAIPVIIRGARVNRADKEANQELAEAIQEARDNRVARTAAISRVSKASRVVSRIVIARVNKAICLTVTVNKDNKKKLHPVAILHRMMKIWTLTVQKIAVPTRIQIAG